MLNPSTTKAVGVLISSDQTSSHRGGSEASRSDSEQLEVRCHHHSAWFR